MSPSVTLNLASLTLALGNGILTVFLTIWFTAPLKEDTKKMFKKWLVCYFIFFVGAILILIVSFFKRYYNIFTFQAMLSGLAGIFTIFFFIFAFYVIIIRPDHSYFKTTHIPSRQSSSPSSGGE